MVRLLVNSLVLLAACASMSRGPGPQQAPMTIPGAFEGATGSGDNAQGRRIAQADGTSASSGVTGEAGTGSAGAGSGAGTSPGAGSPADAGAGSAATSGVLAGDPGAEADFNAARALFDRGDRPAARAGLEGFVAHHASSPLAPTAHILLARLDLASGQPALAKKRLEPLVKGGAAGGGTVDAARYVLGLAELRLGNPGPARELLTPFLARVGAGGDVKVTDDTAVELRGALAEAAAGTGDATAALELLEQYYRGARPHEQAWARQLAAEAAGRLSPEAAWRAYGAAPERGLTRAVLGARAAALLRSRGDTNGARFIDEESSSARQTLGFEGTGSQVGPGDPGRIGLAIPLSGKLQVVGEAVLRAAMLASAAPGPVPGITPAQLMVRDTATDPARAARGIEELTRTEAVIGVVGAAGAKSGAAAIARAAEEGVPLLALDDSAPGAPTTAFQVFHSAEARAGALARSARKLGVKRFAILGPDSAVGRRLRDAFRKAVAEAGGTVVADASYVAGATSFSSAVASVKKGRPEAIFVPESAERLSLIAPALAVADLWPQPWGKPAPASAGGAQGSKSGRSGRSGRSGKSDGPSPVLLLSTANDLSSHLLTGAGRYVQGAMLCPGFFADESDPRARAFVDAYRAAYGQDPHAVEAYAYDAINTLRSVGTRGARTRTEIVKLLGSGGGGVVLQGLTGDITFGADHGRTDSPIVYVVEGDEIRRMR